MRCDPDFRPQYDSWPATVPAVAQLLREGLEFQPGLTILVGENGSGKSTVIELVAEAYGLNPQGGSVLARYQGRVTEPGVGQRLQLERCRATALVIFRAGRYSERSLHLP